MRGVPIVRLLFVVALFSMAAWPVIYLTSERKAPPEKAPDTAPIPEETQRTSVHLLFTSARPLKQLSVTVLGESVGQWKNPGTECEVTLEIVLPPEGADVAIEAEWDEPQNNALRIRAEVDYQILLDRTLWGRQSLSDSITLAEDR